MPTLTLTAPSATHPDLIKCLIAADLYDWPQAQLKVHIRPGSRFGCSLNDEVVLWDAFAALWLVAGSRPGAASPAGWWAQVVMWHHFSQSELMPFVSGLVSSCGQQGRDVRFRNKIRTQRLHLSMDWLNSALANTGAFLTGTTFCLADLIVAVDLLPALVHGWTLASRHSHLLDWHSRVSHVSPLRRHLAALQHCSKGVSPLSGRLPADGGVGGPEVRVLCLHGYRQNDTLFRDKLGGLRKMLGKKLHFTFISAPHPVAPLQQAAGPVDNQDQRAWWFSTTDDFFKASYVSDCDKGLSASVRLIEETCQKLGPFHGVLGFSQGAALAAMLCAMNRFGFRFAMLFCGFRSQCSLHAHLFRQPIHVASLHVFGLNDQVIGSMSDDLARCFIQPVVHTHPGGHFVPATSQHRPIYQQFVQHIQSI